MSKTITVEEANKILSQDDAILIDVRQSDEFRNEHIAYAASVPLDMLSETIKKMDLPSNKKIIFHCNTGKRSQKACDCVSSIGEMENQIFDMQGGIEAWKQEGLNIISQTSGLPIMRQVQIIVGGFVATGVLIGFLGITFGYVLAGLLGAALCFAGITGWCGLAQLLSKMPWNK